MDSDSPPDKAAKRKGAAKLRETLRKLAAEKDWKQADAAKNLGVSPAYISQVLNGITVPSTAFLRNCIKVFGLPQDRAFELWTASFETRREITLDLDKIASLDLIDRERLSKLIALLTVGEMADIDLKVTVAADDKGYNLTGDLESAIDRLWAEWFAYYRSN
jgi:transcriptional regulator with XRE-family HTH domain